MRILLPALAASLAVNSAACLPARAQGASPIEVSGVVQTDLGEPLPGATVFLKGTYVGGPTNAAGVFRLDVPADRLPAVLQVSFVGYETAVDTVREPGQPLTVVLQPSLTLIHEVVVSASRVEENALRAGATVDKLNAQQLGRLTTPDLITGLARQKGVDVTTSGMFMASLSTRGFQGATSERLVQLVDYMDTQSPSLNINAGNALGLPEVDVASVEVLHGPSSALYGANAFNGVVLSTSKDPFEYQGLSVRLRGGTRDYLDGQLRYALKLGRRWAFKVSGGYARANDWVADNEAALGGAYAPGNNPAGSGLGYDAVNRYGDVSFKFGPGGGALNGKTVFMPGWSERELIADDRRAALYRVLPSVHFLVTDKIKALVEFKRAQGTTAYQFTNRYRLKNFATDQYRAELKADNWFVRGYQTQDFGADTYDLVFTGAFMQTAVDPRSGAAGLTYAQQYFGAYARAYNAYLAQHSGDAPGAEQAAQVAAAPYQLPAGTPEFDALRARIIADPTAGVGSRVNPSSLLRDLSGQYDWRARFGLDVVAGGAYRQYRLGSDGHLFADREGSRIRNEEYGGYLQLSQPLAGERLKLTAAGRVDGSRNFAAVFSPRASAVLSLGAKREHNLRASYNQAYRSPTQQGQYLDLDLGRVYLLGNVGEGFQGYSPAVNGRLGAILAWPPLAALELPAYEVDAARLKPERVATVELGYKGLVLEHLVLDVNAYYSRYRDFIGQVRLIANTDGSRPTLAQLAAAAASPQPFQNRGLPTRVIQVQANAAQEARAGGGLVALTYTPLKTLGVTGNYTLNLLDTRNLPEGFQTYYNTPKHKFNVGAFGEAGKVFTYSLNYRWAQGHWFETPFAAGELAAYSSLDAQLGYRLPVRAATLQAGGSNLLNANNVQVFGGPQVGRLIYLGLSVEVK